MDKSLKNMCIAHCETNGISKVADFIEWANWLAGVIDFDAEENLTQDSEELQLEFGIEEELTDEVAFVVSEWADEKEWNA